jgi:cytidyltransferase-like protein
MRVAVSGSFDDLRSRHVRFLEEAARMGEVHVLLWCDEAVRELEGREPRFPEAERLYLVESIRHVRRATVVGGAFERDVLPLADEVRPDAWAVDATGDSPAKRAFCMARGIEYRVVPEESLRGFPVPAPGLDAPRAGRKRVIVTGCYDWLHSGHVRFFEEASALGDLFVTVGHDANIRLLKGEGHPLFPQEERRYMVGAIRFVAGCFIASGGGWLDAEPEIRAIRPDVYVVNEDGDRPEKRQFCRSRGIEYAVLRRLPRDGLPRRQSTALRGF